MSKTEKIILKYNLWKNIQQKKNNLKFRLEVSDKDEEDFKTNINEKNEINEILANNSRIIQKVKKMEATKRMKAIIMLKMKKKEILIFQK